MRETRVATFAPPSLAPSTTVVVLCAEDVAPKYRGPLRTICYVATTTSPDAAIHYVARVKSPLLIVDADGQDGGVAVCDAARATTTPPSVLVTLTDPEAAGRVIDRCDSVLLKPFTPSLLSNRVSRLLRFRQQSVELRNRGARLRERSSGAVAKLQHLRERTAVGTLIEWPNEHCPFCKHSGVVLFDYSGQRRAWYACPECRKVWLAKRLE